MGEVWRARDTRLERTVAIKALPAEFAADAGLRLRLEREAKAISALNHPNICTLYDIGREDGLQYLVMEYVEGESLAERLNRGPLPAHQIVRYGMEIADALDRAHKVGIVHRDLKPANIMITKDGAKLLDFGLAKPVSDQTETHALTAEGNLVGTLQYMAPEQLEGGDIDPRTDIFALGIVLYEMAAGRRPFPGTSKTAVVTAILTSNPQPVVPAALDRIVRTCLAKDPDERFQSARDVRVALSWMAEERDTVSKSRPNTGWMLSAVLALVVIALAVALWRNRRPETAAAPVRLSILPPDGYQFEFVNGVGTPAISPDGTMIVFTATKDGKRRLWLRRLETADAQPLAGTDEAINPFWSPDNRSIGFFSDDKLKRLDITGGAPVVICDAPIGRGGAWNADGTILFGGRATPIMRVQASGGEPPVAVTELDVSKGETTHRWPVFLPDGRHFLYLAARGGAATPDNSICLGSLEQKMHKQLLVSPAQGLFLNGYLLFVRRSGALTQLNAQRFDEEKLALAGESVALSEQQVDVDAFARPIASVSPAGTLVYHSALANLETQLIWYARSGKQLGVVGEPAFYGPFSLSRDGRFVYVGYRATSTQSNIWSYDLERGVKTRVTFGDARDSFPVVSPDGKKLVYSSGQVPTRRFELRLKDLTSGGEKTLYKSDTFFAASDWSPDGRFLLIQGVGALTRTDVWWMDVSDGKLRPYVNTPATEGNGRFSPDGKWVTYLSEESGPLEVYLAPFPPTGAKWQVSDKGGQSARWSGEKNVLYYASSDNRIMAVPITLGATPVIGHAVPLMQFHPGSFPQAIYQVSQDGQRFLVNAKLGDEPPPPLTVVEHFDRELMAATHRR